MTRATVLLALPVVLVSLLAYLHARTFTPTPEVAEALVSLDGGELITLPDGRKAEFFQFGSLAPDAHVGCSSLHGS